MKLRWLFNRKELRDFEMENNKLRQERDELKNALKLKEKDNIELGNKIVAMAHQEKEYKKEIKKLKRAIKEK